MRIFGKTKFRRSAAVNSPRAIVLRTAVSIFLIFIVILSVFAVTLVTFLQARRLARDEIRARLLTAAGTAALLVDAESHAKVRFEPQSSRKKFRDLQINFLQLQRKISDARYVYTFRLNDKNQMAFVGYSDDSESESHRGEVYLQETPSIRAAFARGAAPIADPEFGSDRWGTWLSGYAPMFRTDGSVGAYMATWHAQPSRLNVSSSKGRNLFASI